MASTVFLLLLAWAAMIPLVLGAARLLGRLSTARTIEEEPVAEARVDRGANVVALVPRPQNELVAPRRRAA